MAAQAGLRSKDQLAIGPLRLNVTNIGWLPGEPVLFDDVLAGIIREAQRRGEVRAGLAARELGEAMAGLTPDALQPWAGGAPDLQALLEYPVGELCRTTIASSVDRPKRGG